MFKHSLCYIPKRSGGIYLSTVCAIYQNEVEVYVGARLSALFFIPFAVNAWCLVSYLNVPFIF